MGYGVYFRDGRWAGYEVPAICDHPECGAEIDRGLAYICGGGPGSEKGCGLFFCEEHLFGSVPQMCTQCCQKKPPFDPTPDTPEWIAHILHNESWEQWRNENPDQVALMGLPL